MQRAEILIVGGGVAGLATAWQLGQSGRGDGVVLVEREAQLASHSSALNAAILRCLCGDAISTAIAARSARFLHEPPAGFCDVPLVDDRGLVLAAAPEMASALSDWVKGHGAALRVEELSQARLSALAPAFEGDVAAAYLFPDEGRIDIAALLEGFTRGARRAGVTLRRECAVESLLTRGGRVIGARLESGERVLAETTVIAAGGWAARLGRGAGSHVVMRPTRRHLMVTEVDRAIDSGWPIVWLLGDEEFYCRPESGGMLLCNCEIHDVDPDRCLPEPEIRSAIAQKVTRLMPGLADAGAAHFWCGIRTLTADGRFAIGPDPDVAGLFWVAGLGGAGMSCSAELGRIASELLQGRALEPELAEALAPERLVPAA
jgi:D-arginine dehydrogenase